MATAEKEIRPSPKFRIRVRWRERFIYGFLLFCAVFSVFVTIGIVVTLVWETRAFFREVDPYEFLTGTRWTPLLEPKHFGILPLVCGTMWVAVGSATLAIPLGLMSALYLSEYATPQLRNIVKPVLEILAGIPSIVYGYLAVVLVTPLLEWSLEPMIDVEPFNAVSASIVVGVMVLPTVVSLSEDAIRSVPNSLREAAYALGGGKFDVTVRVVTPAAFSGIMASFLLGISRAIGETMAVTLAAGATPKMTANPFEQVQTMTAYIVQVSQGDAPAGGIEHRTIFAVGLTLFVMTLLMNVMAQAILSRYREAYE